MGFGETFLKTGGCNPTVRVKKRNRGKVEKDGTHSIIFYTDNLKSQS